MAVPQEHYVHIVVPAETRMERVKRLSDSIPVRLGFGILLMPVVISLITAIFMADGNGSVDPDWNPLALILRLIG